MGWPENQLYYICRVEIWEQQLISVFVLNYLMHLGVLLRVLMNRRIPHYLQSKKLHE